MEPATCQAPAVPFVSSALVVSELRCLRESIVGGLRDASGIGVFREAGTLEHAIEVVADLRPHVVLMDALFPDGTRSAARLSKAGTSSNVVVFGVAETMETVCAWNQADIAGYLPKTASLHDIVSMVARIGRVEAGADQGDAGTALTRREQEVFRLIGAGLSNKTIGRRLGISVGTTKCHVHNLLAKLELRRRADVMMICHAGVAASRPGAAASISKDG